MTVQGVHLVGSVNYPDAETTFRTAAEVLGARLKRIPDGEVGDRFHWIAFQPDRLGRSEGIERVGDTPFLMRGLDLRKVQVAEGVDPTDLELAPLGYADAALASYAEFAALKQDGTIGEDVRFQVSLPTPAAVVGAFVRADQAAAFEPVYAAKLYAELAEIADRIPHDQLAVQWDTAVEFGWIENAGYGAPHGPWFDDVWGGVLDRAVEQAGHVPDDVELGFHLCYGDQGERHFVEPTDTQNLVTFANALLERSPRRIDWIHLPVPIERDDDAYFAPLDGLVEHEGTEIYLGLVHREDGPEGARRRIQAAEGHLSSFGVATECGCGRAPEDQTRSLLETHREVAAVW